MERVQSLINKLAAQSQGQASAADLLKTTELLYAELKSFIPGDMVTDRGSVVVWLPAGYNTKNHGPENTAIAAITQRETVDEESPDKKSFVEKPVSEEQAPLPVQAKSQELETAAVSSPVIEQKPTIIEPVVATKTVIPPLPRVPMPPTQVKANIPEPAPQVAEITTKQNNSDQQFTLEVGNVEEHETEEPIRAEPVKPTIVAKHAEPPAPPKPETVAPKPFPQYPDVSTLMKNIFPLAPDPAPPARELNQLIVDPAIQLNERLMEKKVELAEVLAAGPKITDLRKAISINDKYQMINSLFRGDEDMFERSIRTLNNFGSLPEAHFWMQRELVLKLGWSEKDEMVKHFQILVSRRFA